MSRVADLFGSRYPIMQGAMGVICNLNRVTVVSETSTVKEVIEEMVRKE